jgi:hypothetical protein
VKILFVHQNFPGQFVHLAPALAQRGHEVMGLGDAANKRPAPVRTLYYRSPEKRGVKGLGSTFVEVATRGEMVAGACSQMEEKAGFVPDVIVGHNGWGETLFLREIWPNVRMVDYAEFAYRARGLDSDFDPEFQSISAEGPDRHGGTGGSYPAIDDTGRRSDGANGMAEGDISGFASGQDHGRP